MSSTLTVPGITDIQPNSDAIPGIAELKNIVGSMMTIGLMLAVLAIIIAAIVWAFGANSSNPHMASRGKTGVLVGFAVGLICGAAVAGVNFFWDIGQQVG
jgi:predicted cation transporter